MTFRQTLDAHLAAIRSRDLDGLIATLPAERLNLIMADGRRVDSVAEFVDLHRGWFEGQTWSLDAEPLWTCETPDLGIVTLALTYRDTPADAPPIHERSLLTLAFAREGDRWVMVHDQNTPIKAR